MDQNLPTVSVVIPARSAADTLPRALESIARQSYPNIVDVVVAVADDETAAAIHDDVIVIRNPTGSTPIGLNLAIDAGTGSVIVRCDAGARLPTEYIAGAVATMERTGAAVVGGMQVPVGESAWERAIANAMTSPFGAGDARYRIGGEEGPAETVYLGVFAREAVNRAGGFDEEFARTQDYELNHRIQSYGGIVWFDPSLKVEYRPRGSLAALARQYFAYGRAKRQFGRKHPGQLRWRQVIPPTLVLLLLISIALSILSPVASIAPLLYVIGVIVAGWPSWRVGAAMMTMHLSWGLGFLTGSGER